MTVWPRDAFKRGYGGKAMIACQVSVQGGLRECSVESESPAGAGFGSAAIALTPQFVMKPATRDGQPVVSAVRIPVIFPTPEVPTGTLLRGAGFYTNMADVSLSDVQWTTAPTYAEVAAAYLGKAREKQVGGRATLSCSFKAGGRIGSCDAVAEEPKGHGFAAAAKSLTKSFTGPAALADGRSTLGMAAQIPFTFAIAARPRQAGDGQAAMARDAVGRRVRQGLPGRRGTGRGSQRTGGNALRGWRGRSADQLFRRD